jgi:transcriptional regulator with XRE-family HTH domain
VDDLRLAFGSRVRTMRLALGLSQEQLAERAELHWVYVNGVERGVRNPGLNTIGKLARALGVTPDVLLRIEEMSAPRARRRPLRRKGR